MRDSQVRVLKGVAQRSLSCPSLPQTLPSLMLALG